MVISNWNVREFLQKLKRYSRSAARHAALTILAQVAQTKTQSSLQEHRVQNLYFHFLPERDTENFLKLIRLLKKEHTFISYSEAVSRIETGEIDRPYLSISFDDGFESNVRAAQLLADESISACFFVCPEMVGKNREYLESHFSGELGNEQRMMTWEEIKALKRNGHEIGSHTMDHSVLATLPLEKARIQIESSKAQLEMNIGETQHFAWPRGRFFHFSDKLAQIVASAGYSSCASAERGAHLAKAFDKYFCIRRENCVASWPISHTLYLLGRSVRNGHENFGQWPDGWKVQNISSSSKDV